MPVRERNSQTKYYSSEQRGRNKYTQKSKQSKNSLSALISTGEGKSGVTISVTERKRNHFLLPLYLNPQCKKKGSRHFIRKCGRSDESTKKAELEEYRRTKRARTEEAGKGKVKIPQTVEAPFSLHSSLLKASFAKELLETNVMADQKVEDNLIPA